MKFNWSNIIKTSWQNLIEWIEEGKLKPDNEEEIQCFLYHQFILQTKTALVIKPKPSWDKPDKLKFDNGKLIKGDWHFPDFILGNGEVIIEIKFARGDNKRKSILYRHCKSDIEKMKKYHTNRKRYFILIDDNPNNCFIDAFQLNELKSIDDKCKILYYPLTLSNNLRKESSRKSVQTMRENGVDFENLGRENANKAINRKNDKYIK